MSGFNRLLLIIIVVMIVIMGVQTLMIFLRKPNFTQVYYRACYTFKENGETVMDHTVKLAFKKYEDLKNALNNFRQSSREDKMKVYKDVIGKLSKDIGRDLEVVSFASTASEVDGLLQIHEVGVIKGIVKKEDDYNEISLGDNEIMLSGDSKLIFTLPEGAKVISVTPTPTQMRENVLVWVGPGKLKFPTVKYKLE